MASTSRTNINKDRVLFCFWKVAFIIAIILIFSCKKEQINSAVISGIVHHKGNPIAAASVTLSSRSINKITTTPLNGEYKFDKLPLGDYQINVGFYQQLYITSDNYTVAVRGGATSNFQINKNDEAILENIETSLDTITLIPSTGGGGSCPYIYTYNGESYVFNGDIYAGAIYPSLERHDYIPLTGLKAVNGEYKIKISNELQERQYTNLAELMLIHHGKDVEVLIDKHGKIHTISKKQSALSALSENGIDYAKYLERADQVSYLFDEISNKELSWMDEIKDVFIPQTGKNSLVLTFNKLRNNTKGKLIVKAKNSNWSVLLWHEFTAFFGSNYPSWSMEQNTRPLHELLEWRLEEGVPIMVSIETENGWEYVDCFNIVGSVISRDMIMALDLSKIHSETIKIKLECAFMFWELDYVAMDFTEDVTCQIETIKPSKVSLKNQLSRLKADDNLYLEHLEFGNQDIITYEMTDRNQYSSIFLHSKGYYEQIIKSDDEPQYLKLLGFMRPGAFAQYSQKRYQQLKEVHPIVVH